MSKLTRTLAVGATLAAISLAGMTTVAHAYPLDPATDQPTRHDARQPPTQGQVGEGVVKRFGGMPGERLEDRGSHALPVRGKGDFP